MNPKQNAKPLTPASFRGFAGLAACLACWLVLPAVPALAADGTWVTTGANATWSGTANWQGTIIPGSTTATNSTDTAWFSALLTGTNRTVTVDSNRNIRNITFDGGNSGNFGYTLSGGSLLLTSGGTISATGAAGAHTDTISAPMTILGNNATYTISNDSAIATRLLSITGNITGQSTTGNTTTLTLGGSNAGTNTIHLSGLSSGTNGGVLALVKEGATTWRFTTGVAQNTQISWSGPITINGGSLLFSQYNQAQQYLNANSITLANTAGAQLDMGTASLNGVALGFGSLSGGGANGGNIVNAGFANLGIQIGYDNTSTTYGGRFIAGQTSGGITKVGTGTLTLTGSGNDAGGATRIRGGTLGLDFSQAWTGTDILANTRAVFFEGGRLLLTGSNAATNSQTFLSTTVAQGNSGIALTSNGASGLLASLGVITRNTGGTLDITLPTGSQSTTNGVRTTTTNVNNSVLASANGANGIAYATVSGTTWAGLSSGNIVALSSYATGAGNYTSTSNVDVGVADSPAADRTVNTLRFNGNNTLTLSGTNTIGAGGVLVTSAATTGATISGGTLRPGSGNELVLINNGAQFTVGSVIANNGANAAALTLSGTGTTILNGLNTYTGATSINGSTVKAGNSQAFGINSAVTIADNPNAVLDLNGYDLTLGSLAGTISRGNTYATAGGSVLLGGNTLTVGASNTATTLGARISGSGNLVKVGTSSLELAGNNTAFTGGIVVKSGSLVVGLGGNNSLGSATVTLGDTSGNNNATLSLNQSVSGANVVLAPGGTGVLTIRPGHLSQTFNGTVSGSNDVVISAAVNHATFTVSGTINNVGKVSFTNLTQSRMRSSSIIGSNVTDVTIENNINDNGNGTVFNEFSGGLNNTGVLQFTGTGVAGYTNMAGVISSASGITVNPTGSYSVLFSAANTFTAPISIQAGTLRADNAQAFGINSPVTLANAAGATLQVNGVNLAIGSLSGGGATGGRVSFVNSSPILTTGGGNTSTTFSGSASGAGGFTKVGTGTFTLSGSNAHTGSTTVNQGTLRLAAAGAVSASPVVVGNSGLLDLGVDTTTSGTVTMSGSAATISGVGTLTAAAYALTNTTGTSTASAILAGTGGLTKSGAGVGVLSGANTYSGTTAITGGVLSIASTSALPGWNTAGRYTTSAGAALVVGNNVSDAEFNTIRTTGSFAANGAIGFDTSAGNRTYAGTAIANIGTGTIGLMKIGSGTLTMNVANTYTGTTAVNEGVLRLGIAGALPSSSPIALATTGLGSGSLDVGVNSTTSGAVTVSGLASSIFGAGTLTAGSFTFSNASGTTSASTVLAGAAATFTKSGAGTTVLSAANTFAGKTSVSEGVLEFTSIANVNGGASNLGAPTTSANGTIDLGSGTAAATLRYTGSGHTSDRIINLAGTTGGATIEANGSGALVLTGANTATGAGTKVFTLTGTSTAFNSIGAIANNSSSNITSVSKTGSGLWRLSGANTYSGNTTVGEGILQFNSLASGTNAQSLGRGTLVSLGVANTSSGEIDYYSATSGTLDKNITALGSGRNRIRNSGGGTLALSGTLTKNGTILELAGGTFAVSGLITGANANSDLFVNGAAVTLSNTNNDYNGPTYVYGGGSLTLGASNVIPAASSLILGGTGSDTGTGTFNTGLNIDTVASLTTSSAGATVGISINGATAGGLTTTGNVTFGAGTDTLALSLTSPTLGRYTLLSYASRTGEFDSVTGNGNYNVVYGGTSIDLQHKATIGTITATPASATIIVGGTTSFGFTVQNSAPSLGADLLATVSTGSNVIGSASLGAVAAGATSSSVSGLSFTSNTVGLGQTGSFTLTDAAATNSPQQGSVMVDVLNHSLASFAATDMATKTLNFGTFDNGVWTGGDGGNGTLGYSIFNIASPGFTDAQTAGLNLYDLVFTSGNDGIFSLGYSQFPNLASGSSNGFSASVLSPGSLVDGFYTATYTLKFRDQQNLSGAANTRDLQITLSANVIVVPEPGAIALAGIGIAAAAYALRRRRA